MYITYITDAYKLLFLNFDSTHVVALTCSCNNFAYLYYKVSTIFFVVEM